MIEFKQVRKRFRRAEVLKGIDLEIARGERVALVGSNGAGKTTLIRCLLGEYTCDGQVRVDGIEPRCERRTVLARVGFVPQLPPPLKIPVGQLVEFAAGVCGTDPQRMRNIAGELGLDVGPVHSRPFVKLSGGQKQKLLIGIALGRESDLLVMDEPAANLDPEARRIFFELLSARRGEAAMIISSHRLDEVAALVNRVVEMDQGRVILDDSVEDAVALTALLACRVTLSRPDEAFAKAIGPWGFQSEERGRVWSGTVAGPDRLRFLGVLSRYAGVLAGMEMREQGEA